MKQSYTKEQRYRVTQKVTLVGSIVNLILAFAQIVGGLLAQSQALIADGFHTLSDLVTDFVVLIAAKMASKDPDDDHPYGHERIETIATVVLGLALSGVAVGIALSAIQRLLNPETLMQPSQLAILLALFGILCKEGLYHYTLRAGEKVNSRLLKANALHHRSDAISSVIVAIGVTASVVFSIPWLDALAAIAVATLIFYMGAKLILDSAMELVDTAWDSDKVEAMQNTIAGITGVQSVHMLRTRKMSNNVLVDVHIQVAPHISVSEGHHIAETVMTEIHQEYDEVSDIVVHIDPEDDETAAPSKDLADRTSILSQITTAFASVDLTFLPSDVTLHYLDGKIEIEINLDQKPSSEQVSNITKSCDKITDVRSIRISHTQ
ncbi:cation diffusion facilitator family transporter [Leucothrix arctica]|uniref:Cation-efflux pump n=1 Tax=Leucothrix arctica TaxID=1481894 RepID=A0A317C7U1_9GAMM|nr:cation diffusion facilitator family transporter [Leucothrix arctica]PWQ94538.1 cation-efflux pump [Leucothrix arctica]